MKRKMRGQALVVLDNLWCILCALHRVRAASGLEEWVVEGGEGVGS